ncbi:hypothetical protein [Neorhizobium galegae]|uniref:hypothetical protein n=1 Tax=Neorhizobium galegae TaxID=399 RepID=UPI000AAAA8FC|nr:hypothetical protein [Neorhizobium galegae]
MFRMGANPRASGSADAWSETRGSWPLDSAAKKLVDAFFEKLAMRGVMVDHVADAGLAEAIATAAVAAPVMSAAPSAPISPAAPEAAGPSVAFAATAARPFSHMPHIAAASSSLLPSRLAPPDF